MPESKECCESKMPDKIPESKKCCESQAYRQSAVSLLNDRIISRESEITGMKALRDILPNEIPQVAEEFLWRLLIELR